MLVTQSGVPAPFNYFDSRGSQQKVQQLQRVQRRKVRQHNLVTQASGNTIGEALSWGSTQLDRLVTEIDPTHGTTNGAQLQSTLNGF